MRERSRARQHTLEEDFTTDAIDWVLDHTNRLKEMVRGTLSAHTIPALRVELRQVFEEFCIRSKGDRLIVEPRLREEFMPEGTWRTLDFADNDGEVWR